MSRLAIFGTGALAVLFYVLFGLFSVVCWFYGAVLSFHAALWLGVVAFFVEPAYWVFGIVHILGGPDLAHLLVAALG